MVVDDKDLLKAPLLGEGGSGKVYDVTDTKSNLRMAVKVCILHSFVSFSHSTF